MKKRTTSRTGSRRQTGSQRQKSQRSSKSGGNNLSNLRDLLIDELQDLYDAENQLVKALPKIAQAANSDELREAIEEHLEQTKGHVQRLDEVFDHLGENAKGTHCDGMAGLLTEGKKMLEKKGDDSVIDAAIISAAQRVEHYEIAGYGCVVSFAKRLGESEAADLLGETLEEEKQADEKLTEIAESINAQAESGEDEEEQAA